MTEEGKNPPAEGEKPEVPIMGLAGGENRGKPNQSIGVHIPRKREEEERKRVEEFEGMVIVPPPVQIIYTSRTHSQLNQVLRELHKTAYVPSVAYLSARDHMCINAEMLREAAGSSQKLRLGCKRLGQKCVYNKTVKIANKIQI